MALWLPIVVGGAALLLLATSESKASVGPVPGADVSGCLPKAAEALRYIIRQLKEDELPLAGQGLNAKGQVNTAAAISRGANDAELEAAIVQDLQVASPQRVLELSEFMLAFEDVPGQQYASDCLFAVAVTKGATL
jgi:hypothetical protein